MKHKHLLILNAVLLILFPLSLALAVEETISNDKQEAIDKLTPIQKYVTLHDGTEPAFKNKYWNHKEPGIYVDVISGKPLFSSTDKFDSGTGWPSFTKPIDQSIVSKHEDRKYGMIRTEVRSSASDSHLGHVFNDGPKEAGGQRYCINSAALRFIHKDELVKEGYGEYLKLFSDEPLGQISEPQETEMKTSYPTANMFSGSEK